MDKVAITQDDLKKRLEQLVSERKQVHAQIVQLQANLHAYDGAIQECEHWLEVLNTAPAEK